jgi:hypothetical protein
MWLIPWEWIRDCLVMFVAIYAISLGHAWFGFTFLFVVGAIRVGWLVMRRRTT